MAAEKQDFSNCLPLCKVQQPYEFSLKYLSNYNLTDSSTPKSWNDIFYIQKPA